MRGRCVVIVCVAVVVGTTVYMGIVGGNVYTVCASNVLQLID